MTRRPDQSSFLQSWLGRDLLGVLRRQTLPFVLVFATGVALTVAVIVLAPRKYRSQAKLLVKIGRENVSLDPTVTTAGETVNVHRTRENEINTALEVMKSRQLIEEVVATIGADAILNGFAAGDDDATEPQQRPKTSPLAGIKSTIKSWLPKLDPISTKEQAILQLKDALEISNAKDASVVEVDYRAKTPQMATLVTSTWVENYLSRHAELNATPGSLAFFERQSERLEKQLQEARRQLHNAKNESGVLTIAGSQESLQQQLRTAGEALIQSRSALAAAEARVQSLSRSLRGTDAKMVIEEANSDTNEAVLRMRDRLFALEIEQRDMQSRLKSNHPMLAAMKEQVDEAREVLASQQNDSSKVTQGVNPMHLTMSEQLAAEVANVNAHEAEIESIEKSIEALMAQRDQLNGRESQLATIELEVANLEAQSQSQFEKHEQARLAAALEDSRIGNVNVVQSATFEERPVTPNKKLCAMLGLVGSLLAAIGLCTVREAARQPIVEAAPVRRDETVAEETSEAIRPSTGVPIATASNWMGDPMPSRPR